MDRLPRYPTGMLSVLTFVASAQPAVEPCVSHASRNERKHRDESKGHVCSSFDRPEGCTSAPPPDRIATPPPREPLREIVHLRLQLLQAGPLFLVRSLRGRAGRVQRTWSSVCGTSGTLDDVATRRSNGLLASVTGRASRLVAATTFAVTTGVRRLVPQR